MRLVGLLALPTAWICQFCAVFDFLELEESLLRAFSLLASFGLEGHDGHLSGRRHVHASSTESDRESLQTTFVGTEINPYLTVSLKKVTTYISSSKDHLFRYGE